MKQQYELYTEEHHKVWELMFQEQMSILETRATKNYLEGIKAIEFEFDKIPRFTAVNELLQKLTGWQVYEVPGIIDNKPFFELLTERKFPATTWIRSMEQLKYIEEPDMFHDVFGHVPLLSEPYFAVFFQKVAEIALDYIDNPTAIELMARVYWYTIEFGLIKEDGQVKIYGAGILSSPGESVYSLGDEPIHHDFDLRKILETPYIRDKFQAEYFLIESYEQLYNNLDLLRDLVQQVVDSGIEVADGDRFSFKQLPVHV